MGKTWPLAARISRPIEDLRGHYDVVVVGSGYGGGIAASRLARAGRRVAVLERGREFRPGEYPGSATEGAREMQMSTPEGHLGSKLGLFDFHVGRDLNALVGCGLGGTSLINANVSLRADPRVLEDPRWPEAFRKDTERLEACYARAEAMLRPTPYPDDPPLAKLDALRDSARALGWESRFYRPPINVTFRDGPNHVGVEQRACNGCGDCVSGCNVGAKNTTLMNYLPDAVNHGAMIFTEVAVRRLDRKDGRWVVHLEPRGLGRERFGAPEGFVTADVVVLAAGALGSTEILLRSKAHGLPLSDRVGTRFTGNGDVLAFAYNSGRPVNGLGFGHHPPAGRAPVGPCITGIVDHRDTPEVRDGFVIEEGSIPGAVAPILPGGFAAAAPVLGDETAPDLPDRLRQAARAAESALLGPWEGATRDTQTFLVMAHDGDAGRLTLVDDRLRIDWPGVGKEPIFDTVNRALRKATEPLRGIYVENPIWSPAFHKSLVTVHPLGGCVMAERAEDGVVDERGRVFASRGGDGVHPGLYVADGSVIPLSLGVNPLLTISAVAERTVELLAADRGWTIDSTLPSAPRAIPPPPAPGIRFTETMKGFFSTGGGDDHAAAEAAGRAAGSGMFFNLTIVAEDASRFLREEGHAARIAGTVSAAALSPEPLEVTAGTFQLFIRDPDRAEARKMIYRMTLASEEGRTFLFSGFKTVDEEPATQLWHQTTTLYVTVHEGPEESGPIVGRGILHIEPADFLKQMTTLVVTNAPDEATRLRVTAEFGAFFAGVLFEAYGGVAAPERYFDPTATPRRRRLLRAPPPEVLPFRTRDGVELRLTRYPGGSKGPAVLVHGAGVSSGIFSTDLPSTNLVEYLTAHAYDVWLLDYRASTALSASAARSNGDQVATIDLPEALALVRERTGAATVQVVAHCWGANTTFMALLAGLPHVRSLVASQTAMHLRPPFVTRAKSALHLPDILDHLGVPSLTAYVDAHADWRNRLLDGILRAVPVGHDEACRNPVCHRVAFLYGPLYRHAKLDAKIHQNIHELFGVANIATFEHLALLVRRGVLVAADGADAYMGHLDRLRLPILFLHGAENQCWLPASTEESLRLLEATNGAGLYRRVVLEGYGHIDCIFGEQAARDVFPSILAHLDAT